MSGGTPLLTEAKSIRGTMERKLKNGKEYRFEQVFENYIVAYCFYFGKWNPLSIDFKSWDEVENFCNKIDYDVEHPKEWKPSDVPTDYYGRQGVYYGD